MTNEPTSTFAAPVTQQERITILDSLRGIAILGILLMNIPGFGLPYIQTGDPSVFDEAGRNYKTWYIVEWALSGTQRAIFSMLFGAGIILFITKLEKRMTGIEPAIYFFRRQLWLLVFGLLNAFVLLWFWDILYAYAIFGMLLFVFYRSSPKKLLILAFVCLVLMTARENIDLYRTKNIITKGELVAKFDTTQTKLTIRQQEEFGAMNGLKKKSAIVAKKKEAEKEIRGVTGDYASVYETLSEKSVHVELYYTYFLIWDVLLFMFMGMAFFKNGILLGKASATVYWIFFIGGFGLGLLLSYFNQQTSIDNHFNEFEISKNVSFQFYQVARVCRSLGFFGLIMLMYKSGFSNGSLHYSVPWGKWPLQIT